MTSSPGNVAYHFELGIRPRSTSGKFKTSRKLRQASARDRGIIILYENNVMDKIKNGDSVLYKNLKGTIYGKPRESKYRGLIYTVKIGNDYVKASPNELTLDTEDAETNELPAFSHQES